MATIEKAPDPDNVMMIDIETLALGPRAFVTQFGVCVANVKTREYLVKPTNYWLSKENQADRLIDFDTVRWWMTQDPKVSAGVFNAPKLADGSEKNGSKEDRVSPKELFFIAEALVKTHNCTVWGSPAMFDLAILTDLWGTRKPWKYNAERDMMTLYKLIDPQGVLHPPNNVAQHDAAADAGWQMEYLFNLLARTEVLQDLLARQESVK